jgi:hypothetical protein
MIAPDVTLKGDNPMIVDVYALFVDPGVTATDNYYPNVFPVITNLPNMTALGDYTVTYTVTDGAGNTTTVTRLVKVVDRKAPEIQLLGANPVEHIRFTPYVDPGVKLKDNYYTSSDLQPLLQTNTTTLDVNRPGIYIVTYQVTDPSGNKSAKVQRLVNVVEVTGIEEQKKDAMIAVFPNPTQGQFTITAKNNQELAKVKIYDVLGKLVYEEVVTGTSIGVSLSTQYHGMYMVWVESKDGSTYNTRVVVE